MAKLTLYILVLAICMATVINGKHRHSNVHRLLKNAKRSFPFKHRGQKSLHKLHSKKTYNDDNLAKRTEDEEDFSDAKDMTAFGDETNNGDYPIIWDNDGSHSGNKKQESSEEEPMDPPPGGPPAPSGAPDMPNTVQPNPNIFGGFPENDIWGNFELPAPATIDHLKLALKMNHHRPNYGSDQSADSSDLLYGYEHHAMPEYDVLETPPFQAVMWQNAQLQQALKGGGKPGGCAPGMGSCPPINNEAMCTNLHQACVANAQHPSDGKVDYEAPCAQKILALFGCGKPPEEPKPKPKPKPKEEPKPKPIPKKKPKEEKPPEPPPRIGEKLTSEDSGSKINEKELLEILTKAHKEKGAAEFNSQNDENKKIELNDIAKTDARQSFHKTEHSKFDDTSRIGLMNAEESLALMTAIGNDLQKSLTAKFKGDANLDDETDTKLTATNNVKPTDNSVKITTAVEDKHTSDFIKPIHTVNDDQKELTSYFTNDATEPAEEVVAHGGERVYSDWSSWTKCNSACEKSTISRRRNCLKNSCTGSLLQHKTCPIAVRCKIPAYGKHEAETATKLVSSTPHQSVEPYNPKQSDGNLPSDDTFTHVVSRFANKILTNTETQPAEDEENDANIIANLLHDKLEKAKTKDTASSVEVSTQATDQQASKEDATGREEKTTKEEDSQEDVAVATVVKEATALKPSQTVSEVEKNKSTPSWGDWTECSKSCGLGFKSRSIQCDGDDCNGVNEKPEQKPCRKAACQDKRLESLFESNCMSLHNEFRRRHGAPPLQWSSDLYRKALEISDRIALKNVLLVNLSRYERPGLNLGIVSLTDVQNNKTEATPCTRAIESWYGQKINYNYDKPSLSTDDRDFTQLVWKSTKRIGIAKTISLDGQNSYIAAVYEPPGNVDSYYDMKKNALPAQSLEEEKTMEFLDNLLVNKKKRSKLIKKKG